MNWIMLSISWINLRPCAFRGKSLVETTCWRKSLNSLWCIQYPVCTHNLRNSTFLFEAKYTSTRKGICHITKQNILLTAGQLRPERREMVANIPNSMAPRRAKDSNFVSNLTPKSSPLIPLYRKLGKRLGPIMIKSLVQ